MKTFTAVVERDTDFRAHILKAKRWMSCKPIFAK
jgi:hypothetical protein